MAYPRPFGAGRSGLVEMKSPVPRPYSVAELLDMKVSGLPTNCTLDKSDSDAHDIIRVSEGDPKRQVNDGDASKSLPDGGGHEPSHGCTDPPKSPSTSSESSDGVLYRGPSYPHALREVKWRLRRRASLDRLCQPISAPSRLDVQKSENFQKFYRAVVSPTHIRVTAGGRVVPNIQKRLRSLFTWNPERGFFNQIHRTPSPDVEQQGAWLQGARLYPSNFEYSSGTVPKSSIEGGLAASQCPNVTEQSPPCITERSPPCITEQSPPCITEQSPPCEVTQAVQTTSSDEQLGVSANVPDLSTNGSHKDSFPEGIKISHPSQFDASRPFIYNGQVVYPVPPGAQVPPNIPMIPNMMGNTHIAHPQPITLPVIPPHLQVSPGNTVNPLAMGASGLQNHLPAAAGFPPIVSPIQSHAMGQSTLMPFIQPSPLLAPALIAVQQIQLLQQQLKSLEIQSLGSEQMDEQHVAIQRESIQNQIFTLQSIFNASVGAVNQEPVPFLTSYGTGIPAASQPTATPTWNIPGAMLGSENKSLASATNQFSFVPTVDNNDAAKKLRSPVFANTKSMESPVHYESTARKRLTAAAAMAPPFRPRFQQPISGKATEEKGKHISMELVPIRDKHSVQTNDEIEAQLLSKSNWSPQPHRSNPISGRNQSQHPILSRLHTIQHSANPDLLNRSTSGSKRFATVQGHGSTDSRDRLPYLRGYPPSDMHIADVRPGEFLYTRRLTEDEIRAKHLYWGKAPQEAMKGLPKWDGKDFYPPSPVKDVFGSTQSTEMKQLTGESAALDMSLEMKKLQIGCNALEPYGRQKLDNPNDNFNKVKARMLSFNEREKMDKERKADDKRISSLRSVSNSVSRVQKTSTRSIDRQSSVRRPELDHAVAKAPSIEAMIERQTTLPNTSTSVNQPSTSLLRGMLRNTTYKAAAPATGAMSSATAHGCLPLYSGSAAASLAPSINTIMAPSTVLGKSISQCFNEGMLAHQDSGDSLLAENRPLSRQTSTRDSVKAFRQPRGNRRSMREHKDNLDSFDQETETEPIDGPNW